MIDKVMYTMLYLTIYRLQASWAHMGSDEWDRGEAHYKAGVEKEDVGEVTNDVEANQAIRDYNGGWDWAHDECLGYLHGQSGHEKLVAPRYEHLTTSFAAYNLGFKKGQALRLGVEDGAAHGPYTISPELHQGEYAKGLSFHLGCRLRTLMLAAKRKGVPFHLSKDIPRLIEKVMVERPRSAINALPALETAVQNQSEQHINDEPVAETNTECAGSQCSVM